MLAALIAGPVAGAFAQAAGPEKPPHPAYTVMIAKTTKSKQSVQAKQGSYCLPNVDFTGGTCREVKFPLPDLPVVRVSKGEEITLLFKAPVGYVTWRTARVNRATGREVAIAVGEGERVTRTKKRWRITMPKSLRKTATIVGVNVQMLNGYNSFEFGIKVR